VNSRRWAWNTNKWENFETFKKSEEAWHPWAILGGIIIVVTSIAFFIGV